MKYLGISINPSLTLANYMSAKDKSIAISYIDNVNKLDPPFIGLLKEVAYSLECFYLKMNDNEIIKCDFSQNN